MEQILLPKIEIEMIEVDAWRSVPVSEYDNSGRVTGPNPNYEQECKQLEGKFRCQALVKANAIREIHGKRTLVPSQVRMISGIYDNPDGRRDSIREMLKAVAESYTANIIP